MLIPGTTYHHSRTSAIVLLASIVVSIGWMIGQSIDVYRYAWLGAVFEILWIPMLVGLVGIPVFSIYRLLTEKFSFRSRYLYALLIILLTVTIISIIK
jgi:hypothetical protein